MNNIVEVYTDGAALGSRKENRGSGWAYKMIFNGHTKTDSGDYIGQTSNRMEMMAVYQALKAIHDKTVPVVVYSDSQIVVNVMAGLWIPKKNLDLWGRLVTEKNRFKDIRFEWVRGHNGNPHNEEVDRLAEAAAKIAEERRNAL